jgi:catechol 2,3-dioxygenase-like lactoylglutathione lyase family enzyme
MTFRLIALTFLFATGTAFGQGRCQNGYGTPACPLTREVATAPIAPVFASTGWKTVALDHITYLMPDYEKEAAFYNALLGWKLRSNDGTQAVMDIGDWGSAIFKPAQEGAKASVESFCWVIAPWNAKKVEAALKARGMTPVAENDDKGFESFHVKDPNGFDLQISNGKGLAGTRMIQARQRLSGPAPFAATGWHTVWLDHMSYNVANYKQVASFYENLLGWKPTYDEGSQNEMQIGEIGDIIVRGGNPNNPAPPAPVRREKIDHISWGISPWDTDAVKAALDERGLKARIDTGGKDDIHTSVYKSYHTTSPNGMDVQISFITHDNRQPLLDAVKPKP